MTALCLSADRSCEMTPIMKVAAEYIRGLGHSARFDTFLDHYGPIGHRLWGYLHRDGFVCMEGERVRITEKAEAVLDELIF